MTTLSIPTTSALPSSHLLPSNHSLVTKTLYKLPRPSLISLALDWLDDANFENCPPYLSVEDENDAYPPAESLDELQAIYKSFKDGKGTKREVLERILEGDWRDGISLYQLAMADMQYLFSHPQSLRWTAFKITPLGQDGNEGAGGIPRFHPPTFLRNLQKEGLPDIKAHYNLDRHPTLPLLLLRVLVVESPYVTPLALASTKRNTRLEDGGESGAAKTSTLYVAFPDSAPFVYLSLPSTSGPAVSTAGEKKSVQRLLVEAIPKAFSKPRERYTLEPTSLSARNLEALVQKRGGGREGAAGAGWGDLAKTGTKESRRDNPLNTQLPTPPLEDEDADELGDDLPAPKAKVLGMKRRQDDAPMIQKRRKLLAQARFGSSAKIGDGKGIERLDIRIQDHFPSTPTSTSALEADPITSSPPTKSSKGKGRGRRSDVDQLLDRDNDEVEETSSWKPDIRFSFLGTHVFAGVRLLVEAGIIDGRRMPGWLSGEEGVSVGVVRDGRVKGFMGSGV